jgi:hypothetical protein
MASNHKHAADGAARRHHARRSAVEGSQVEWPWSEESAAIEQVARCETESVKLPPKNRSDWTRLELFAEVVRKWPARIRDALAAA